MLNFWNFISSFSFNNNTLNYYTPDSVNYFYGFGSLSGVFLLLQIFTGIVLAFHYVSDTLYAFDSVSRFTREVPYGWLFSNMHQTGTTFLFVFLYLHMASGIFFNSYNWPNMLLWCTGVLIFFLVVVTAFLGYVLPWSQLGFWAATVITNMLTSIPLIGGKLVIWIWGGFSVQNNTLNKFAALHFCIPFLILGIIFLHLVCLHEAGSSNMLSHGGAISETEFLDFFSYFINKDLVIFSLVLIVFLYFVCLRPNFFSSIHTHVPADPLVGIYVVPEWYFLPLFGFIKCVSSNIMGVCLLSFFFVLLLFLPLSNSLDNLNTHFSISGYFVYSFLVVNLFTSFVCLGLVASNPLTESIFIFSGYLSLWFFISFIAIYMFNLFGKNNAF